MEEKRTRVEEGFRNTKSKDGSYSTYFSPETSVRINRYCRMKNLNRAKFCETCMVERLDALEAEMLQAIPKEALIEMVLKGMSKDELMEMFSERQLTMEVVE